MERICPCSFKATYKFGELNSLPACTSDKIEETNKIIVPASVAKKVQVPRPTFLDKPICFMVRNKRNDKRTYCALYDYGNEEGITYVSTWVMNKLQLKAGDDLEVRHEYVPRAVAVVFKTHFPFLMDCEVNKKYIQKKLWEITCINTGDEFKVDILLPEVISVCKVYPHSPRCVVEPHEIFIYFDPKYDATNISSNA